MKKTLLLFFIIVISFSLCSCGIISEEEAMNHNSSYDYSDPTLSPDYTTASYFSDDNEYDEDNTENAYFTYGDFTFDIDGFSIVSEKKKKVIIQGNSNIPFKVVFTKMKNKGKSVSDFTYDYFNDIVEGLGSTDYSSNEILLDNIEDVALLYNINDSEADTSVAFVQHQNCLYSVLAKRNKSKIKGYSDDDDDYEEYEYSDEVLEHILEDCLSD